MGLVFSTMAQDDTLKSLKNVKLEMLKMPDNAAFTIMGTTPSEIQMPGSAPEFAMSIQNASNDFSQFPNNYGFSVTPYWWIYGKKLSFEDDFSTRNELKFFRHLRLSGGVVNGANDNNRLWRYGAGLQATLLAGKIDSSKRADYQRHLLQLNRKLYNDKDAYLQGSVAYRELEAEFNKTLQKMPDAANDEERAALGKKIAALQAQKNALMEELNAEYGLKKPFSRADSLELYTSFNDMATRYGWKWDIGIATAFDLQSNKLDSSSLYRLGGWTNFGYSLPPGKNYQLSILGAGRFYYYDQVVYALESSSVTISDLGVIDGGVRLVLDAGKISLSAEGLYRYGLSNAFENTYKVNAMLNYRFAENRMVYFSLGNDFNDNSVGDPNQIRVFLGVNLGFGDKTDVEYQLR